MTTAKRQHDMPFGAQLLADGRVRFRLWAPAAVRVDVCLSNALAGRDTAQTIVPMKAEAEGWFGLTTALAAAGTRYRFRIDSDWQIPDPASRFQPDDVHGPSTVIDPGAWEWRDTGWRGRPWEETIAYELHVGSFTPQGTFAAVEARLDYLVGLGVTAIELMPVGDFPGARNWGYDGAYLFAPDSRYGTPNDLKSLIDGAHARGLMVFLDVVYNHFGPEGNYLHLYAPQFFSKRHQTAWGAAINYDGEHAHWVREFVVHNALYWLEEYHFDGLRLDAVHAISDSSQPDILTELAERVHHALGDTRHFHLVLENDHNAAHYLAPDTAHRSRWYTAQWNDDIHHALHVVLTREADGYYMDYADDPVAHLARCFGEGFAYQGECSAYRNNKPRGEPSAHLPATAFVSFLQNHDQVGNRAFGERISVLSEPAPLRAALSLLLLAPAPPLLFMGQEWGCTQPFPFFCDFGADLADQVVAGRRQEFARFPQFRDPDARAHIPDPMDRRTFEAAVLDWTAPQQPQHREWVELHRHLLTIRRRELIPRLGKRRADDKDCKQLSAAALSARWVLADGSVLVLLANLADDALTGINLPPDPILHTTHVTALTPPHNECLPAWSVFWYLHERDTAP